MTTAYEHLDLIGLFGRGDVGLDKLATDVPRRAGPASSRWFIESMHDFENVRMRALERVELEGCSRGFNSAVAIARR